MADLRYIVYGLLDTRLGSSHYGGIRYVGKSTTGMKRPKTHLMSSALTRKKGGRLTAWLQAHANIGVKPEIEILEIVEHADDLSEAEIYWIGLMLLAGANLKNLTRGGDGAPGRVYTPTEATKKKIADANRGRSPSDETRAKTSATLTGRKRPQSVIDKMIKTKSVMQYKHTDEWKKASSLRNLGRKHTEETKIKMRKPKTPEHIENARRSRAATMAARKVAQQ